MESKTENTRIIGPTPAEFAALDRGATLILGVPSEGMQPIREGQELLAIEGWNPGDEPRMDVRRQRLLVTGQPVYALMQNLSHEQRQAITGIRSIYSDDSWHELDALTAAIAKEARDGFGTNTPKLLIPVKVLT
jgi:hypothetical protein